VIKTSLSGNLVSSESFPTVAPVARVRITNELRDIYSARASIPTLPDSHLSIPKSAGVFLR